MPAATLVRVNELGSEHCSVLPQVPSRNEVAASKLAIRSTCNVVTATGRFSRCTRSGAVCAPEPQVGVRLLVAPVTVVPTVEPLVMTMTSSASAPQPISVASLADRQLVSIR